MIVILHFLFFTERQYVLLHMHSVFYTFVFEVQAH